MPIQSTNNRLQLFPITTLIVNETLTVGGYSLMSLAEEYNTPLYVYDQVTLDQAVNAYRQALTNHYPGNSAITYAGKAFLCTAVAQWAFMAGLWLDCTGVGELQIAQAARFPRERILVHGVNKSETDLKAAVSQAGTVVVDNLTELDRLIEIKKAIAKNQTLFPDLWLRWRPGHTVDTHTYTQTGHEDSKFGMGQTEILAAIDLAQLHELPVRGIHFHQGSHFHNLEPTGPALDAALDLLLSLRNSTGWQPEILSPGGGWGVSYHEDDLPHPSIESYASFISRRLAAGCQQRRLPLPRLHVEPGRSLIARAGVAIYHIGAIKETRNRLWYLIDGGLADNPRPALYQTRYTALPVARPNRPSIKAATLAGPFCESGDILIHDLPLPDLAVGDLIAVPVSGAYQLSMSSNYNGALKPAVVWIAKDKVQLIQEREQISNLTQRDIGLY